MERERECACEWVLVRADDRALERCVLDSCVVLDRYLLDDVC